MQALGTNVSETLAHPSGPGTLAHTTSCLTSESEFERDTLGEADGRESKNGAATGAGAKDAEAILVQGVRREVSGVGKRRIGPEGVEVSAQLVWYSMRRPSGARKSCRRL